MSGITYTAAGGAQLGNLSYTYDADGRRTAMGGSLAAVNLPAAVSGNTFNADNGMTGFNGTTLSHDANGNLTSDGTSTYTWDARNHLTGISGGASASFVYDAFGRRVSKTINGTTTQFLYDGLNPVQELNGSNPPTPTANLLTGLGIDEYFTRTDSSGTMAFLRDALGSTIALANSSGAIATQYTYEPFGNTTISGNNANPFQFTSRENDGTGLYYFRARYYSPTFQRFIAQDPIGFAGGDANLYAYTREDSVNLIDAFGTCPHKCAPSGSAPSPSQYESWGESSNWIRNLLNLYEFHRGGSLDAQAYGGSTDYANYVFGVYLAAHGYSLSFALWAANEYASKFSHYSPSRPMDPTYPATPASNIADITSGFNDERSGNLCTTFQ